MALAILLVAAAPTVVGAHVAPKMPATPVPALVRRDTTLTSAAGRLTVRPVGATRVPIRILARAGRLATLWTAGWHDVWAWQASGPFVALWVGMPPQARPTTGDYGTEIVVLNVRTRTLVLETSINVQTRAYLVGSDLVTSGACGLEMLRWCLGVYDLSHRTVVERVYGKNVGPVVLVRGRLYGEVYVSDEANRRVVERWSLPPSPWRRLRSEAIVRVALSPG